MDIRLRVAKPHFAQTGISTALPAPPWKRASPLAHGRGVAVRAARLERFGHGCIHHAPEICMAVLYVLVRTYHSVRKCKEPFIFGFILEPFLFFRAPFYGRVCFLDRFLT